MELNKQDICALQCAVLEAIGLNVDLIHDSTDPADRRALEATVTLYRRALQKLRTMEATMEPSVDGDQQEPLRNPLDTVQDAINRSQAVIYCSDRAWLADTADLEATWRSLCQKHYAIEVAHSMFRPIIKAA